MGKQPQHKEQLTPFNPLKIAKRLSLLGLVFGAAAGLLGLLLFALFMVLGYNPWVKVAAKAIILDIGVLGIAIAFGLLYVRNSRNPSILKLWEGLITGAVTTIVCALVSGLGMSFYASSLFDQGLESYKKEMGTYFSSIEERLIAQKDSIIAAEDSVFYQNRINSLSRQLTAIPAIGPPDMMVDDIAKKLLFGFFLVPIISIVLRRR